MTLLPMENREGILCALKCFEKEKPNNIPPILEDYIRQIARNGQTMLPWVYVKPLLLYKFNKVVDSLINENTASDFLSLPPNVNELRQRVFSTIKSLEGIPFTIQRICELFESPFRHYSRPDKFLRGLEKVCLVVSTIDPHGNKLTRVDPRFPNEASLGTCDGTLGRSVSPPASPSVDELHRQQTSKSSDDDDEITDDDNEDEDDNHTENSSSVSPVTPSMGQPPVLANASVSGAWPFGANGLGDLSTSKINFCGLVADNSLDRQITHSAMVVPLPTDCLGFLSANESGTLESSRSVSGDDEKSDQLQSVFSPNSGLVDSSVDDTMGKNVTDKECNLSPCTLDHEKVESVSSRSFLMAGNLAVTSPDGSPNEEDIMTDSNSSPLLSNDFEEFDRHSFSTESVPPIVQILRPIGQLEAFVQNMGADVPVPSSVSPLLSSKGDPDSPIFSPHEFPLKESFLESSCDSTPPVVSKAKKRSISPNLEADSPESFTKAGGSPHGTSTDYHQSPAKRRRFTELSPSIPESPNKCTFCPLDGSPPLILCNPDCQNRDRESGERTGASCTVQTDVVAVPLDSDMEDLRESHQVVEQSAETGLNSLVDSETGEREH